MPQPTIEVSGRPIGGGAPPYLIAEIGINHGGDIEVAKKLLIAAKGCGVDAAKLQAFLPEKFLARSSPYYDLLASCALGAAAIQALMTLAREINLTLFSAVFDEESADILEGAGAPAFKIASGDLTHLPLLRHVARIGKPMLISTGGATMGEIATALDTVYGVTAAIPVALFHCVSNYPTAPKDCNLASMEMMRKEFDVPVGFSDHTLGHVVSLAAAGLGAELIEKHFTLNRGADGPDHALSLDPDGMTELARDVAVAYEAIGSPCKVPVETADFIPQMRRSVTLVKALPAGAVIDRSALEVKRPGTGIAPNEIDRVVGRRTSRAIAADTTLTWTDLA